MMDLSSLNILKNLLIKNFSDKKFNEFFTEDVLRKQVEDEIDEKLKNLDPDNEFYVAMKEDIIELRDEKLEAIEGFIKKEKDVSQNLIKKR